MDRHSLGRFLALGCLFWTAFQPVHAYDVYHSYDEPVEGVEAQLYRLETTHTDLAQVQEIGRTIQDRPILALRLTNESVAGDKPAVLFVATIHAREWISTEVAMRLAEYLTTGYGTSSRVTSLLDTTEIWIVPVANPDGYEYSFNTNRLWRKNLRDNDGDGTITMADGVDLNRNFDSHWAYNDEGSSPLPDDADYRGTAPHSEPETQALMGLAQSHDFAFVVSYGAYGNLIGYPWGWQVSTRSFDEPIFVNLTGTPDNPAIWDSLHDEGYIPGLASDTYTVNGGMSDWLYEKLGILAIDVYLTRGIDTDGTVYDFEFPDDEAMVQTVFEDNLDFALSIAESAADPAHPISPVGLVAEDVYHTPLTASHGPNQMVEVLARKDLQLTLHYSFDGGNTEQSVAFEERRGAFYNQQAGTYYSRFVASIEGQTAADSVTYRITGGEAELGDYAYTVTSATGNPILVVAAEDYSGDYPVYPSGGPHYLSYYVEALDAVGRGYDVWDVDLQSSAPDYAEVLSHYPVVIWYTGDDYAPTVPDFAVHEEQAMNLRKLMNFNCGTVLATGQDLAWLPAVNGWYPDDFFQYQLGAISQLDAHGMNDDTNEPFDIVGVAGDPVFGGLSFALHGGTGADNQGSADTLFPTSYRLPQFDHVAAAKYLRPGDPFSPYSGDYFVSSNSGLPAYSRLGGTFALPAGSPELKFWVSYDLEAEWDFVFVEIRDTATDAWTTLPDSNGLTTPSTGESCRSGWVDELHPFLAHYIDVDCNPTGTTGTWNAMTGDSGGWHQVRIDLAPYAGKTVELYISYATDWTQNYLGTFVDEIEISGQALEDFEAGMGVWGVGTAPGSPVDRNWARVSGADVPISAAVRTRNSVYLGFGFEAIDTAAHRAGLMDNVVSYLEASPCDSDGDGLPDDVDACPGEDATGFDADGDGCVDTVTGLTDVIATLVALGAIDENLQNSLTSKINNALSSADRENICAAVGQLQAFKNQIEAQRGKKISGEAAELLIQYVDNLIAQLLGQLPPGEVC